MNKNKRKFLLDILKKIENIDKNVFTCSYKVKPIGSRYEWWEISVSSASLYSSERFVRLKSCWQKLSKLKNIDILFVYRSFISEEELLKYSENDELLMIL